jgi:hypothetical protein
MIHKFMYLTPCKYELETNSQTYHDYSISKPWLTLDLHLRKLTELVDS